MSMSVSSNSGRYEGAIKFFTDISKNESVSARGREGAARMVDFLTRPPTQTSVTISAAARNAANTDGTSTTASTSASKFGSLSGRLGIAAYNANSLNNASLNRVRSEDTASQTEAVTPAPAPTAPAVQPVLSQASTAALAQSNAQANQVLSLL